MDSTGGPPLPLAGFRVLGFTRFPAGPYAAMALAGLGADVIKVEPPAGAGAPSPSAWVPTTVPPRGSASTPGRSCAGNSA